MVVEREPGIKQVKNFSVFLSNMKGEDGKKIFTGEPMEIFEASATLLTEAYRVYNVQFARKPRKDSGKPKAAKAPEKK